MKLCAALFPATRLVKFWPGSVGGVPGEWSQRKNNTAGPRLLYLHGGGFVACSPRTHRPIIGAFALRGFTVFAPDYRLAPEHPFPAAIDDAIAAWREFSAEGPAAVAGDSAGGNLALALMLRARDEDLALPTAAALFSPVTDFLYTGDSHVSNAERDAMFEPAALRHFASLYLGSSDPRQPLASPLYADLSSLPPLLIHCSTCELLRDDATQLAAEAEAAGVPVTLRLYPVVAHVWQFAHSILPEARHSMREAAAFLKAHSDSEALRTTPPSPIHASQSLLTPAHRR